MSHTTTTVKDRINLAADLLRDEAVVAEAQGKAIVWALSPEDTKRAAQWLRTVARCLHGDEDHTSCRPEECTALAALEFADVILKGMRRD